MFYLFGRAVLRNVVNAGYKIVCEATLNEDDWVDFNLLLPSQGDDKVADKFNFFLKEWQKFYKLLPEFKVVVVDIQTFLSDLRLWLDQVEMATRNLSLMARKDREHEIINRLQPRITTSIHGLTGSLEEVLNRVEPDLIQRTRLFAGECYTLLHYVPRSCTAVFKAPRLCRRL